MALPKTLMQSLIRAGQRRGLALRGEVAEFLLAAMAHTEGLAQLAGELKEAGLLAKGLGRSLSGGSVAVIPVYGVIMNRSAWCGTSVSDVRQMLRQALGDPTIGSILFDFDSPGGSVDGVPELAAEILASRGQKPMGAAVNTECCSAAYWLASACDELEIAALAGFVLSALIWLIVAVATPAPMVVVDAAKIGARHVHDRLPAEIRERIPDELRLKITGS